MAGKYEVASEETVPIARAMIAKALMEKYGMREAQAAKLLGVAQAAISKYITGKYSDRLKGKVKGVEARTHAKKDLIDGYIKEISEGREEYVNVCICTVCGLSNGFLCGFSQARVKDGATKRKRV